MKKILRLIFIVNIIVIKYRKLYIYIHVQVQHKWGVFVLFCGEVQLVDSHPVT